MVSMTGLCPKLDHGYLKTPPLRLKLRFEITFGRVVRPRPQLDGKR